MKVPSDLTSTVLRYKLDPGEPGLLKSATPGKSMQAVTNQELGNLRQFTREAAENGYDVVSAKIEYKTAIVDGKLSIKAGRTTVYSVPTERAAEARYEQDSKRIGNTDSTDESKPKATAESEIPTSEGDLNQTYSQSHSDVAKDLREESALQSENETPGTTDEKTASHSQTATAADNYEEPVFTFTRAEKHEKYERVADRSDSADTGRSQSPRRTAPTEQTGPPPASAASANEETSETGEETTTETTTVVERRLDNERAIVEARLDDVREQLDIARSTRENRNRLDIDTSGMEGREAMLEMRLNAVNQKIATIETRKMLDQSDRYAEVARENNDAQKSTMGRASSVSAVAGGFSTVI